MKFAFLIHPLSRETESLVRMEAAAGLRSVWGVDPLASCGELRRFVNTCRESKRPAGPSVVEELGVIQSQTGSTAIGRLYSIPLQPDEILENSDDAVAMMQQAVEHAVDWGAEIVGLGSMTGIVGGRGAHLSDMKFCGIATGTTLTAYAAAQNLYRACNQTGLDLSQETVAVVGIPGSIASAAATLIAPHAGELLLVGRRESGPAQKLAAELDAEFLTSIPEAVLRARVLITATSTGGCIEQSSLQPGTIVIDVGVPTDVIGHDAIRDDVLILTGGLSCIPDRTPRESTFLWFQHGMVPSCLGETMTLALENRPESFSIGRNLSIDGIHEIGEIARRHGFGFNTLRSFGYPVQPSQLTAFRKQLSRRNRNRTSPPQRVNSHGGTRPPGVNPDRAIEQCARTLNPVLAALSQNPALGQNQGLVKTFVRGEGNYLWDIDDNRYLDLVAGFGSVNLGHNPPAVRRAIEEALKTQAPGFVQAAVNPWSAALAEALVDASPAGLELVTFANSGTEAVEAALKLARAATGKAGILACERAYHGKTLGALSVTGNPRYQQPFRPLVPECDFIPFGDGEALERSLATGKYAAFIVEPVQGEGGMVVPPEGYLQSVQAICREAGVLFLLDEIQTGMGRTGWLFASEEEELEPDVMMLAKSLGGGLLPIGAMLCRREIWQAAYGSLEKFTLHSSTFAGGSLACAAGLAALQSLADPELLQNVRQRSTQFIDGLMELCRKHHCLKRVRGRGLMLGLEFEPLPSRTRNHWQGLANSPLAEFATPEMGRLLETLPILFALQSLSEVHGIYAQPARSNPLVLRIQPPLSITETEVETVLRALETSCSEFDYALNLTDEVVGRTTVGRHEGSRATNVRAESSQFPPQ